MPIYLSAAATNVHLPDLISDLGLILITAAIAQTGAAGPQDMGKLMAVLKPQLAGKADMGKISALVKAALAP